LYLAKDDGLIEDFEDVLDCDGHSNFASVNYKAPPEGATPATSVLTFSDCKYREGVTFSAVSAAMAQWSQHLSDEGSVTGIWHWYPAYGGGGEEFDFKWPRRRLRQIRDWRRLPNQGQVAQSLD